VPRVISLIVLLAIILFVGAVFFQVMAQFLVPLFMACVLLVVFYPLHLRVLARMPRFPRLAALITTTVILLVVCVPLIWLGWNAYLEGEHAVQLLQSPRGTELVNKVWEWVDRLIERVTGRPYDPPSVQELLSRWTESIGQFLLTGVQTVFSILFGIVIMVISLYFFLADGPAMIKTVMQISPLAEEQELELLAKFGQISRSVVIATMASAVAQGIAAGIGYYFWLPSDAPIFLLTALTMLFAIVPFVGAAGIWVPVCGAMLLMGNGGEPGSNWPLVLGFAIYCAVVVSGLDNVIKPYVLHGHSNLHPLLALLSILGGVQVLGPVGILVGPMLVSFLQALLSIFQREVESWDQSSRQIVEGKLSPAAEAIAEVVDAAVTAEEKALAERSGGDKSPPKKQTANVAKGGQGKSRRRKR
jgi:predicted PurR-regulated permease PerM